MHLLSFVTSEGHRLGARLPSGQVADLAQAAAAMVRGGRLGPDRALPGDMRSFLAAGDEALAVARDVAAYAAEASDAPWRHPEAEIAFAPPVPDPRKLIGIGLNYRDHCLEAGLEIPEQPLVFTKSPTSNIGHGGAVLLHKVTEKVDYEAELAFVVGKPAKNVPAERGLEYVAGYTCFNDVSARDIQIEQKNFTLGKLPDTFGPNGPYLVTRDEAPDPQTLAISLRLNGETMQDSNTSNMILRGRCAGGLPFARDDPRARGHRLHRDAAGRGLLPRPEDLAQAGGRDGGGGRWDRCAQEPGGRGGLRRTTVQQAWVVDPRGSEWRPAANTPVCRP